MTAIEELKLRLVETLSEVDTGKATADSLKDHWWLICHAMRAAIKELRQKNRIDPEKATSLS